jgi:hypothetical protein
MKACASISEYMRISSLLEEPNIGHARSQLDDHSPADNKSPNCKPIFNQHSKMGTTSDKRRFSRLANATAGTNSFLQWSIAKQSRGNRRGGIIRQSGGLVILKYAWGLRTMTNNEAEAYTLYEGIRHATLKGIRQIIICGDSMILIRAIIKQNIAGSNIYRVFSQESRSLLASI